MNVALLFSVVEEGRHGEYTKRIRRMLEKVIDSDNVHLNYFFLLFFTTIISAGANPNTQDNKGKNSIDVSSHV